MKQAAVFFRLALAPLIAGIVFFHCELLYAGSGMEIQKCTRADGSILFQADVCPVGTTISTLVVPASGPSTTLTLIGDSNHQFSSTLTINGVTVSGHIDTGATFVTISKEVADKMHITSDGMRLNQIQTANGIITVGQKVITSLKVGNFDLYNVEIAITSNSPTLIGMTALSQLKLATENNNLILSRR